MTEDVLTLDNSTSKRQKRTKCKLNLKNNLSPVNANVSVSRISSHESLISSKCSDLERKLFQRYVSRSLSNYCNLCTFSPLIVVTVCPQNLEDLLFLEVFTS